MLDRKLRHFARMAIDLGWVALSAPAALVIRENFILAEHRLEAVLPYAVLCVLSASFVFLALRLPQSLWRYVSLGDVLRLGAAIAVALLLALLSTFILNRLEGVARSLPVIQWFLLMSAMVGSRIAVRVYGERRLRQKPPSGATISKPREHVLVVGLGELTELYLRALIEVAPTHFIVEGLVCSEQDLRGRRMRTYEVLGKPEDLSKILDTLEIHGVSIDRIVVTEPFEHFAQPAQEALRDIEQSTAVSVMWLTEALGLREADTGSADIDQQQSENGQTEGRKISSTDIPQYHRVKRALDGVAALMMTVVLFPFLATIALLVAMDVGPPLVFWQKRPGRHGKPIKLFKFRTMRAAHDEQGNRVPDDLRSSAIGRFLRRSWLDELPQLYNILLGEMSFVGPRPLLPIDQPENDTRKARQLVRPGLTGWAQVNGGRDLPPEQKVALDLWYVMNASLWVDIQIVVATLKAMLSTSGGVIERQPNQAGVSLTSAATALEGDRQKS